jgi:predicted nucleic-acid-binding protein
MQGLDTNILVRFFAQDDLLQAHVAESILAQLKPESPGFVSLVALAELIWVLRTRCGMPKSKLIPCIEHLLNSPELVVEGQEAVEQALVAFAKSKAQFADCLIERSGRLAGCVDTVTFDKDASRLAGMRLI